MRFPTILYRVPGRIKKPRGGTYSYVGAADQAAFDKLLAKGWFPSYEEAKAGKLAVEEPVDETSPPSREEMEIWAKELGISFNARTSDTRLSERIKAALEA
jgi:hypothetical protein